VNNSYFLLLSLCCYFPVMSFLFGLRSFLCAVVAALVSYGLFANSGSNPIASWTLLKSVLNLTSI